MCKQPGPVRGVVVGGCGEEAGDGSPAWARPEPSRLLRRRRLVLTVSFVPSARAEHYWWRGQNTRTLCVGPFPRHVVTSVAGLSAQDISQPLQNSFIHTGHGDSDPRHCWGFPDKIDE